MVITSSLICSYIGATSSIVVEQDPGINFSVMDGSQQMRRCDNQLNSRPVFQTIKPVMNISLIPFGTGNCPGSMQEIAQEPER
jgi:hypothetical protein